MRKTLAALLPAVLLVAIALWEIVATHRARAAAPEADWQRAEQAVRASFQPGDLITFAPDWIDPIGRLHLGDLIPLDVAGRMDAARFPRIWELSIRGAHSPDTRGLTAASEQTFGDVTLRRFDQTPPYVFADLVSLAPSIVAEGARASGPSIALTEVGFAPHRCVEVVPQPGGTVVMSYGKVPLGSTLVGYAGLADVFTRRDVRDPGELDVRIDGTQVASLTFGVDDGWKRFQIPTPGGMHQVQIVATAVGPKARDRHICFAAEARQ